MAEEQIKHLKELHEKATPGPWKERASYIDDPNANPIVDFPFIDKDGHEANNRALIVELRNSFPALIEELERIPAMAEYYNITSKQLVEFAAWVRTKSCLDADFELAAFLTDLAKALEER